MVINLTKGASIFFNGCQNLYNVQIWVSGWVSIRWNPLKIFMAY